MKHQFALGIAMVAMAVTLWGVQFPVAKELIHALHPVVLAMLRSVLGVLVLLPVLALAEGRAAFSYRGRAGWVSVMGTLGMSGSPVLIFIGMWYSRPEHAAILVALQPSMGAVTQWLTQNRRPSNFTIACMAIALAGVVVLVTKGALLSVTPRELAGDFLILLGVIAGLVFNLGAERFPGWSPLQLTTLTLLPAALVSMLLVVAGAATGWVTLPDAGTLGTHWIGIAYLSLGCVAFAMMCWVAGIKRVGAVNAMLLTNLTPVVTFSVRYFQGETYVAMELAGGVIVIGALVANNLHLRRELAKKTARAA
ncbi:MAG: DMT family transporter [Betaproteobacteria bacterium]|nr:DMT family transporter [Betaproteobacteria bacterium]